MKKPFHRLTALVLALSICMCILSSNLWAAELDQSTEDGSFSASSGGEISALESISGDLETPQEDNPPEADDKEYETTAEEEESSLEEIPAETDEHKDGKLETQASSGKCGKNLTWKMKNGTLTISGTGEMYDYYDLDSPWPWYDFRDKIKTVVIKNGTTSIGKNSFNYCKNLASVTIPDSVLSIEGDAFFGCESLKSLVIPNSVSRIGPMAFSRSGLESVTLPSSLTEIEYYSFSDCDNLTSVTIPDSVTSIGYAAFSGSPLSRVTIPNSVTEIRDHAFAFTALTSVTIPNSVTTIEEYVFWRCKNLTSVTIPNSVTTIRGCAFESCSSLASVNIPDSVTFLSGFKNCSSLASVNIPDSVTEIGGAAFSHCFSLTSVTIPNSVSRIGPSAFSGCDELSSVTMPDPWPILEEDAFKDTPWWKSFPAPTSGRCGDNVTWSFDKGSGLLTISGRGEVTADGYHTDFRNKIKSVEIEDGVTGLYEFGFRGCDNLTSITIPGSVPRIASLSICGCNNLNTVRIMDGVKCIDYEAFSDCPKLANVIIPASVTFIGGGFDDCGKFTISGYTGSMAENYAIKYNIKFKSIGKMSVPSKTILSSVKAKKGRKITVTWKKNTGGFGYQVQYSTDKKFKKGVKTVKINSKNTTQKTISKLKAGKTYYVRIRTVKGSLTSGWSAVKSAKAKQ